MTNKALREAVVALRYLILELDAEGQLNQAATAAAALEKINELMRIRIPKRYESEYKCPRCETGSHDLRPDARAIVMGRIGDSLGLRCDVCGHGFLIKLEAK